MYSNNAIDDSNYKFGNINNNNKYGLDDDYDLKRVQEKIDKTENESLESTYRALRMLNETEQIGVDTATELVRQGEQLQGIDTKLDDINENLNATQRHLNNIKSVFGGLKNRFFGKFSSKTPDLPTSSSENNLKSMNKEKNSVPVVSETSKPAFNRITNSDREEQLEQNLDEMSKVLSRLKNLGTDMASELERQDPLISRITSKTEIVNNRIANQNQQMNRLK